MRIDPCSKRFKDINIGYTCVECGHVFSSQDMYYIMFKHNSFKMCKCCLFNTGLMFNDMFEFQPLLDGTDPHVTEDVYKSLNIPEIVFKSLLRGKNIQAIKDYRELKGKYIGEDNSKYYNIRLKDAKEQIDEWREIVKPRLKKDRFGYYYS